MTASLPPDLTFAIARHRDRTLMRVQPYAPSHFREPVCAPMHPCHATPLVPTPRSIKTDDNPHAALIEWVTWTIRSNLGGDGRFPRLRPADFFWMFEK